MTRLSFTQTTQNALRELTRLEAIKANLASLIVDLKQNQGSEVWVREYTNRLTQNVIPAMVGSLAPSHLTPSAVAIKSNSIGVTL